MIHEMDIIEWTYSDIRVPIVLFLSLTDDVYGEACEWYEFQTFNYRARYNRSRRTSEGVLHVCRSEIK